MLVVCGCLLYAVNNFKWRLTRVRQVGVVYHNGAFYSVLDTGRINSLTLVISRHHR